MADKRIAKNERKAIVAARRARKHAERHAAGVPKLTRRARRKLQS